MRTPKIKVDEEFERLLPPLKEEEFELLERDIVENGVRDPIVIWAETGIIVDGHNRYRICQKHKLGFSVREQRFFNRAEAADWMVKNQKSRRNLTKGQEADIAIRLHEVKFREEAQKKQTDAGKKNLERYNTSSDQLVGTSVDSEPDDNRDGSHSEPRQAARPVTSESKPEKNRENETAYRIAKESGIGVGTIKRVMAVHKSGEQDLIDGIQSGELSANAAVVEAKHRADERKRKEERTRQFELSKATATLHVGDPVPTQCDALITEAPDDPSWLASNLACVSDKGFAYIILESDPDVIVPYLTSRLPPNVELYQMLVWRFGRLMGNRDTRGYKSTHKIILFYRGVNAGSINYINANDREDVLDVDADNNTFTSTELKLPYELAARLIKHSTKEYDTVFDPFANHGAILDAAKRLNRNAVGYETDESKVEEMRKRGIEVG